MKANRKPILAANWKMNKTKSEVLNYISDLKEKLEPDKYETILFVPTVFIDLVSNNQQDFLLGSQNIHYQDNGAFTGETSVRMLLDYNVNYTLVGHSERRAYYNEKDGDVNLKIKQALKYNLKPMVCVGEDLKTREAGKTKQVVETQIKIAFLDLTSEQAEQVVIAYEPIWAIGTGKTPTADEASQTIKEIRNTIKSLYSQKVSDGIRILYGGSVNANNLKSFLEKEDIDGALIGGAALDSKTLLQMTKAI